jgi:DNA-binding transcriptional LysR family regulator
MSKKRVESVRLVWLEAFVAVVDHGGYTAAAKVMGSNQSTVTRWVDGLERWLRKPLFISEFSSELSPHGVFFLEPARKTIELLNASRAVISGGKED